MRPGCHARVLFVCMGNICRSPTVEAVFRKTVAHAGMETHIHIDSAGTGDWHVGHPPDRRAVTVARRRGYDLTALRARQVSAEDFAQFDWILAMDRDNLRVLEAMRPDDYAGHLGLFLDFSPELALVDVPDPYGGEFGAFELVLDLAERGSKGLLAVLQRRIQPEGKP